jgi:hypothetical protein
MTDGILRGTVEVQCAELIGPALDWAVAKAVGWAVTILPVDTPSATYYVIKSPSGLTLNMSSNWSQCGPLIDRERIMLEPLNRYPREGQWCAGYLDRIGVQYSEAPLVAVCRAIVAAHLGEVVSVPAELT